MSGIRELIQNAKLNKRAKRSGRPDNEQIHSRRASGNQLVNNIASIAATVGSIAEVAPMFGELPRLPNPDRSGETAISGLASGAHHRLLNEIDDRYDIGNKENFINKLLAGKIEAGKDYIENKDMYKKFFANKTLQKTNMFICAFSANNTQWTFDTDEPRNRDHEIELAPHHFKSVNFKVLPSDVKIEIADGSFPIPFVDAEDISYEFSVTFEEDAYGTVFNFIQSTYAKIAGYDWINNDRHEQSIGSFGITTINEQFNVLTDVVFEDVILISAGDMAYDYSDASGTREYSCTFRATSRTIRTLKVRVKDITQIEREEAKSLKDGNTATETEEG
jgi:hypothetical protein